MKVALRGAVRRRLRVITTRLQHDESITAACQYDCYSTWPEILSTALNGLAISTDGQFILTCLWNVDESSILDASLPQPLLPFAETPIRAIIVENLGLPGDIPDISHFYLDIRDFSWNEHPLAASNLAKVYQGRRLSTGEVVAIKMLYPDRCTEVNYKREVLIPAGISHPTLLPVIGCTPFSLMGRDPVIIVTPFMEGGSLQSVLARVQIGKAPQWWSFTAKMNILYGIAVGLHILHSHRIVHRDLKPGNVVLDDKHEPKICDFGLSKVIPVGAASDCSNYDMGTLGYQAPEQLLGKADDFRSDIFSFGSIIYALMTGLELFSDPKKQFIIRKAIIDGARPTFPADTPVQLRELGKLCWNADPALRPTSEQVVGLLEKESFMRSLPDLSRARHQEYRRRVAAPQADDRRPEPGGIEPPRVASISAKPATAKPRGVASGRVESDMRDAGKVEVRKVESGTEEEKPVKSRNPKPPVSIPPPNAEAPRAESVNAKSGNGPSTKLRGAGREPGGGASPRVERDRREAVKVESRTKELKPVSIPPPPPPPVSRPLRKAEADPMSSPRIEPAGDASPARKSPTAESPRGDPGSLGSGSIAPPIAERQRVSGQVEAPGRKPPTGEAARVEALMEELARRQSANVEPAVPVACSPMLCRVAPTAIRNVARPFKVVFLGNSCAGKTTVVYRVMTGRFPENEPPTIDTAKHLGELRQGSSGSIFEIWDTAGQERYGAVTRQYARGAQGAILVFDVTDRASFQALPGWVGLLRESAPDAQIVIFANKIDLAHRRTVTAAESETFADDIAAVHLEGSAMTCQNVRSIFQILAEKMRDAVPSQSDPQMEVKSRKWNPCRS
jgi:small GTP-binding protein